MTATNAPLIAAARSQMTASSPRVTFSPPELTADRVITRCITRSISAPGATIPAMPGDVEPLLAVRFEGPGHLERNVCVRLRTIIGLPRPSGRRPQQIAQDPCRVRVHDTLAHIVIGRCFTSLLVFMTTTTRPGRRRSSSGGQSVLGGLFLLA
jgi:hypothetical protein